MSAVLIREYETEDEISNEIKEITKRNNDHFACKVSRSYVNRNYMHLSKDFVIKNNLHEHCDSKDPLFKLRVEEHICKTPDWDKKRWELEVIHNPEFGMNAKKSRTYFGSYWLEFVIDNGLQFGDHVVLRLDIIVKEFILVGVFRLITPPAAPIYPKKKGGTTSAQKRKKIDLNQDSVKKKKNADADDVCAVDQEMMIQVVQTGMSAGEKSSTSTPAAVGDSMSAEKRKQIVLVQDSALKMKKNDDASDVCNVYVEPKFVPFLKMMSQGAQSEVEDLSISTSQSGAEQLRRIMLQGGKFFSELMEIFSIQSQNMEEVEGWKKRAVDAETEVSIHARTVEQLTAQVKATEQERDNLALKLLEKEEEHKKTLKELRVVMDRQIDSARNEAIQSFKASEEYNNILTKAAREGYAKIMVMMKKHLDGHEVDGGENSEVKQVATAVKTERRTRSFGTEGASPKEAGVPSQAPRRTSSKRTSKTPPYFQDYKLK